jgi:hypothetical protein
MPRSVKALETFGDLRGVKRFTDLLRHYVVEILEFKVTVAVEVKVGNRPPPKGGYALGMALPTATSQQEHEKDKRVGCPAANECGAAAPCQTAQRIHARHSRISLVATHSVVYPSTRHQHSRSLQLVLYFRKASPIGKEK